MRITSWILAALFAVFLSTGCGPSAAEQRARQVAQAKDDALKLRQQLAQAKTGPEAEDLRQRLVKGLTDASLTLDAIHFSDSELNNYVKAAAAASAPPPAPKPLKPARQSKARRVAAKGKRR